MAHKQKCIQLLTGKRDRKEHLEGIWASFLLLGPCFHCSRAAAGVSLGLF